MSRIMTKGMRDCNKRIVTEQHRLEHKGIDSKTAHILAIRKEING